MLSDLYAMGVCRSENMLMLLGVSNRLSEAEREIVVPQLMRGFQVRSSALISSSFTFAVAVLSVFWLFGQVAYD